MTHSIPKPDFQPLHLVFCLYPRLPLFCLASALDVLRHANRKYGKEVYRWSFVTEDDEIVSSSTGLPLSPTTTLKNLIDVDRLFFIAGFLANEIESPKITQWIKSRANKNLTLGGLSNGGFILASAGLLDDYHATVHWEDFSGFCALYPKVNARYQRFVIDKDRMTCSGGAATLDLFLELVRQDLGNDVATFASRQMLLQDFSYNVDGKGNHVFDGGHRYSPRVQRALSLLDAGVEEGLSVTSLAERVGLSRRELLRLFRRETGRTPTDILHERRLERARSLILRSHLPLISIADAVGFSSQSHMTKNYREHFGITPSKDRQNITNRDQ